VEGVVWLSDLRGCLAGAFSFSSVWLYFSDLRINLKRRGVHFYLAIIFFCLAVLSKPSAAVVGPILFIFTHWLYDYSFRRSILLAAPWVLVGSIALVITKLLQPTGGFMQMTFVPPFSERIVVVFDALGFYVRQIFWPFELAVDYGRRPIYVLSLPVKELLFTVPLFFVALAMAFLGKNRKFNLIGLAVFLVGVGLTLGLIPFDYQRFSTVADRYLYFSMFGVGFIVMTLLIVYGNRVFYSSAAICVLVMAGQAYQQSFTWTNSRELFSHSLQHYPAGTLAYVNYGNEFMDEKNYDEAILMYKKVIKLAPNRHKPYANIGKAYSKKGEYAQALKYFKIARERNPYKLQLRFELALSYKENNQPKMALEVYENAIADFPKSLSLRFRIAKYHYKLDQHKESEKYYQYILNKRPNSMLAHYHYSLVLKAIGRQSLAEYHSNMARKIYSERTAKNKGSISSSQSAPTRSINR